MRICKRIALIALIVFSCVGCDQITKAAARDYLASASSLSYLGDPFRLQYAENTGAFLSLGSILSADLRFWLFTVLSGIFLTGLMGLLLLRRNLHPGSIVGLSLVLSGGAGNLIDRTSITARWSIS